MINHETTIALLTGERPIPGDQTPDLNGEQHKLEPVRQKHLVDLSARVEQPPIVLEVYCSGEYQRLATLGNFLLIIGKAKSRKTFFMAMLAAAMLRKTRDDKFMCRLTALNYTIVVFDTEQSLYDVHVLNQRIVDLVGSDKAGNIEFYHLRPLATKERLELVEYVIYNTPGLAVVVIDGIRDLVVDINSPDEASLISNKLLKWTEERNIHIVTVLHQNKADNNARGHVGTELINKAESVLSIAKDQKDPDISIVTPEYFRGKEFSPFAFRINADGLPEVVDEFMQPLTGAKQEPTLMPHQIPDEMHQNILVEIFRDNSSFKYKEMINQISLAYQAFGQKCGANKAGTLLTHFVNKKWIQKDTGERYPVYKVMTTLTAPL